MYNQLKKMRQEEGFTLIELLIVIVILGILAAIVVFSVSGITDRGSSAACKSDASELITASEAFYAQGGTYPAAWGDIVPKFMASQIPASVGTTTFSGTADPTFVGPNPVTTADPYGC